MGFQHFLKTETFASYYEIIEQEAEVVRKVFELYSGSLFSIGAVVGWLNHHEVPTRKKISRWERSTVWAMLRNPAYVGRAYFGKTESTPRQRITRPLRYVNEEAILRGAAATGNARNRSGLR
ncbi:MAG: recombinase family protein [Proteobacteria bacterium]|nr:recombinase family protein [Pseudomonadota bacterium]MBU4294490.1 recombinase family protein [Pseudomonadota bacterium]